MARNDTANRIKKRLTQRRAELRGGISSGLAGIGHSSQSDPLDNALASTSTDVESRLLQHGNDELRQVDAALARIEAGTFGVCEDCRSKIPAARLEAMPFTACCVTCQAERERTGRTRPGHDSDWERVADQESELRGGPDHIDHSSIG